MLIHSPLVCPATWRWVAEVLQASGHEVVIPDLREAAVSGNPRAVIEAAIELAPRDSSVIVGHSGAGFFLPSIAAGLSSPARSIVFVDAGMPPCEGDATASVGFLDQLRSLAIDGVLPKWSTWWGDGVMEMLVPDDERRAEVEDELPEIPLALYEAPVAQPAGWCDGPGAFLLLSETYRHDATTAVSLDWPVLERLGSHLELVNDPRSIAHDLVDLAR